MISVPGRISVWSSSSNWCTVCVLHQHHLPIPRSQRQQATMLRQSSPAHRDSDPSCLLFVSLNRGSRNFAQSSLVTGTWPAPAQRHADPLIPPRPPSFRPELRDSAPLSSPSKPPPSIPALRKSYPSLPPPRIANVDIPSSTIHPRQHHASHSTSTANPARQLAVPPLPRRRPLARARSR